MRRAHILTILAPGQRERRVLRDQHRGSHARRELNAGKAGEYVRAHATTHAQTRQHRERGFTIHAADVAAGVRADDRTFAAEALLVGTVIEADLLERPAPEQATADEGPLEVEPQALAQRSALGHERTDAAERQQRAELPERGGGQHLVAGYATAIAQRSCSVAPPGLLRQQPDAVEAHPLLIPEPREGQHVLRAGPVVHEAHRVSVTVGE